MTEGSRESSRRTPVPGTIFGPYTIIDSIGAGGMGEVFRAHDAKLNRDVALKFLPEVLSSDKQLLARFEREAELLARVNHPNIATIHSIEDDHGHPFLVLELVEGETLKKMLEPGPLPLRDALKVCRDIAVALEAAHRKGIVHRDLKPANVMVTDEGLVKVLDFGIAKRLEQTRADDLTSTGMVVGTGPYIPPEQIRGKPSGRRGDIWTFGCVLFETLTGAVAFGRDDLADTMTSILGVDPDWGLLPAKTPESIRRLLRRCLEKDPTQRLQAIGDARIEIDEAITGKRPATPAETSSIPRWKLIAGAAAMLAVGVLIGVLVGGTIREDGEAQPDPGFYDVSIPANTVLGLGGAPSIDVSRDGSRIVVVLHDGVSRRIYRRDLNWSSDWMAIPGTDGAEGPFFSWDGDRVGFFANSQLHWVPYDGSAQPEDLGDATEPFGGAWAADDTIYYSSNQSLWTTRIGTRISEGLMRPDPAKGEVGLRWPSVLPDGETVLYTIWAGVGSSDSGLRLSTSGEDGPPLLTNAEYARYSRSGHLVFTREGELFAIPFDPNALTITGDELSLDDDVLIRPDNGVPFFALAAQTGTLVRAPGGILTPGPVLAWMDATRQSIPEPRPIVGTYETLRYPRLSPNARQLAVTIEQGGGDTGDAGIVDLNEMNNLESIVDGATTYAPEWNPDGTTRLLAHLSLDDGRIYAKTVFTRGNGTPLTEAVLATNVPTGWAATQVLFYTVQKYSETAESMAYDVHYVDTGDGVGSEQAFLDSDDDEYGAVPSPDGNWVAYVWRAQDSEETEVRVTSFPAGEQIRVASTGTDCQEPTWSADGSQLFFRCDTKMWVADIRTTPELDVTNRQELWDWPFALDDAVAKANYAYDSARERFLLVSEEPIVTATDLKVDLHWYRKLLESAGR